VRRCKKNVEGERNVVKREVKEVVEDGMRMIRCLTTMIL
jgi:hypothetical protein